MAGTNATPRWPQRLADVLVSFLALHGAFNIGIRTEVLMTLRVFAVIAGLTLLVAVVGSWMLRKKDASPN